MRLSRPFPTGAVRAGIVGVAAVTMCAAVLAASSGAGAVFGGSAAAAPAPTTYFLSLGDSLAAGHQPSGDTDRGYADLAYADVRAAHPGLELVKLGCTGETSTSMFDGSVCRDKGYAGGSQASAAVAWLTAHPGQTRYLTLDVGANDVSVCALSGSVDVACAAKAVLTVVQNLARLLDVLHRTDPTVGVSVGLTYYDPFLATALLGRADLARESLVLQQTLNLAETALYARYGYRVADVATAFRSADSSGSVPVAGLGTQPTNVAYVCRYTFICTDRDIHPTDAGYALIARTVAAELR